MVNVGDMAPEFTVPCANGDITSFRLSEHLDEAPLVLVFFPAAFSSTCTTELQAVEERQQNFEAIGATLYGVSIDTPYTLNAFRDVEGLTLPMLSDFQKTIISAYDLEITLEEPRLEGVADRAVLIIDSDQRLAWQWRAPHPGVEPPYETVQDAAAGVGNQSPEGVIRDADQDDT